MSLSSRPSDGQLPTTEPERFLLQDDRKLIEARIRGLNTNAECIEWLDFEAHNRKRTWVIAAVNQRQKEIREADDDV